jgi:hypothetical protein
MTADKKTLEDTAPTIEQLQQELEEKNKALAIREQVISEQKNTLEEMDAKFKGTKTKETVKIGKVIGIITCERFIDVPTKRTVTAKELAEDKEMCARLIKEKSPIIKIVKK